MQRSVEQEIARDRVTAIEVDPSQPRVAVCAGERVDRIHLCNRHGPSGDALTVAPSVHLGALVEKVMQIEQQVALEGEVRSTRRGLGGRIGLGERSGLGGLGGRSGRSGLAVFLQSPAGAAHEQGNSAGDSHAAKSNYSVQFHQCARASGSVLHLPRLPSPSCHPFWAVRGGVLVQRLSGRPSWFGSP